MKLAILAVLALSLTAQTPPPAERGGRGGRGNAPPPVVSCEVKPDRTVIFRMRAPEDTDVKIGGDFVNPAQPLTKGDDGVWSITLGPLNPAIYSYTFRVNGVSVIDPINPMLQIGERSASSMFEVPS